MRVRVHLGLGVTHRVTGQVAPPPGIAGFLFRPQMRAVADGVAACDWISVCNYFSLLYCSTVL
jgi:hypothetical protein